jgi:hypothetical protein
MHTCHFYEEKKAWPEKKNILVYIDFIFKISIMPYIPHKMYLHQIVFLAMLFVLHKNGMCAYCITDMTVTSTLIKNRPDRYVRVRVICSVYSTT